MGAILDLPSSEWFGDFSSHLRVHIIDSHRPQNLASLFGEDHRIVVWDDVGADKMDDLKKAWIALVNSPDESDDDDSSDEGEEDEDEDQDEEILEMVGGSDGGLSPSKIRRPSSTSPKQGKRKKLRGDKV
jgi:cell division control protein 45